MHSIDFPKGILYRGSLKNIKNFKNNLNSSAINIRNKEKDLKGQMITQGTTPRRLTDLIGSLCDLTSGSGDKGTPVIFIQGYFDNLASE